MKGSTQIPQYDSLVKFHWVLSLKHLQPTYLVFPELVFGQTVFQFSVGPRNLPFCLCSSCLFWREGQSSATKDILHDWLSHIPSVFWQSHNPGNRQLLVFSPCTHTRGPALQGHIHCMRWEPGDTAHIWWALKKESGGIEHDRSDTDDDLKITSICVALAYSSFWSYSLVKKTGHN